MESSGFRTIVVTSLLASSLNGCGGSSDQPPTAAESPPPAAAPPAPATATPETTAAAPPAPASAAPTALASGEGELPNLRVEIQELKRTAGDTLTLKLAFVNTGQQEVKLDHFGSPGFNQWSLAGISLVDIVGKKKYFTASDSDGKCLCSMDISALQPQGRVSLWAKFPAPPADVQKISILIPRFAPFEEIPISG
jgi:hypothetical protein